MMAEATDVNGQSSVPDGGYQGWMAVVTLFMRNVIWVVVCKGLGVMLPILHDQLASETWILGWITAMVIAMSGVIAPFSGIVNRGLGVGNSIMVCGAMIGVAYIGGSFASTDVQLAWLFVLFAGVGLGVSNVLAKEAVGRRFTKNYATASGIARTGYAVGLLVFAPLIQLFLNTYGWRGTMMLMGGVSLHLVVCGAVLTTSGKVTPQQTMYHQVSDQENSTSTVSQNTLAHRCSGVRENLCKNLDMRLLGIGHFWALAVMMCCTIFADDMWIIYFVSQAQSNGFTAEQAGSFVSIASVGGVIGKVVQGLLTDCGVISSWSLTAMSIILSSAGYCSTPLLTSYWASAATAFLILCSSGVLACQVDVFIKQVMGVELLAGAFAWVGLLTAGMSFFAGFLPGLLYDLAGSYTAAFLIVGAVQGIPLIPLAILRYSYGRVESAE